MASSTIRLILAGMMAATLSGALFKSATLSKRPIDYLNEADPAFNALLSGDVGGFVEHCPAYCGSLILRAPVVLAAAPGGSTDSERYLMAALPGIIATIIFALMVWRRATPGAGWLVILLVAFNPIIFNAYRAGHPEELIVAVLCIGAMLAAGSEQPNSREHSWAWPSAGSCGPSWPSYRYCSPCRVVAPRRRPSPAGSRAC